MAFFTIFASLAIYLTKKLACVIHSCCQFLLHLYHHQTFLMFSFSWVGKTKSFYRDLVIIEIAHSDLSLSFGVKKMSTMDLRQALAGLLTLSMFIMLGNMIKKDHFDYSYEVSLYTFTFVCLVSLIHFFFCLEKLIYIYAKEIIWWDVFLKGIRYIWFLKYYHISYILHSLCGYLTFLFEQCWESNIFFSYIFYSLIYSQRLWKCQLEPIQWNTLKLHNINRVRGCAAQWIHLRYITIKYFSNCCCGYLKNLRYEIWVRGHLLDWYVVWLKSLL